MKRINLAIVALALLLMAFSQCKKQEQSSSDTVETISITLRPNNNNGTKADVNPNIGTVVFTQGDVVYVSSNGKFVGTLTNNGNTFSGNITNPEVGEPLYFYFFGNKTPSETLTEGSSTQCSVIISDQTENLPVVSCGPSNENFTGSGLYTAFFYNKCALVKFDMVASSTSATCLTGLNNKVMVNFANNSVSYGQENNGLIKLNAGNGEKWAILLPQAAMEAGEEGSAYSEDGIYTGIRPAIPAITENGYLTEGISVSLQSSASEVPEGAINGLFTVNANGDQVYFSQGNLQYQASTNTWRFASNQWNYVGGTDNGSSVAYGNVVGSRNNDISPTYNGWIDLFGWGTSGYNHGATAYQPWSTSTSNNQYYAYGSNSYNLYDQNGQADWGSNAISNGGSGWRTPTRDELVFVFNTRTDAASKYGHGIVNGVNGLILLPDDWTLPEGLSFISGNSNWVNEYSATQWTQMEANGAVFFPAAGYRFGSSVYIWVSGVYGYYGYYWASSFYNNNNAYGLFFRKDFLGPQNVDLRYYGHSVRLIRDVQ